MTANGGTYNVGDQATGWNHVVGTGSVTNIEDYFINSQNAGFFGNVLIAQKDWSGLLTIGEEYTISFDIVDINGFVIMVGPQGINNIYTTTGTKSINFTASLTDASFSLWSLFGGIPTDVTIDNLKLTKLETVTETCTVPVGSYRYGFNGMEKDDEVKGNGNSYDFGARMYDSRLGRWLSIDGFYKDYPGISTYTYSLNNPIIFRDFDGNVVIGGDGKPVTYCTNEDGSIEWSSNATADIKKLGNLMLSTENGTKAWDKMEQSSRNIHIQFVTIDEEPILNKRMRLAPPDGAMGMTMTEIDYQKMSEDEFLTEEEENSIYEKEKNEDGRLVKSEKWNETVLLINMSWIEEEAQKDLKAQAKRIKKGKQDTPVRSIDDFINYWILEVGAEEVIHSTQNTYGDEKYEEIPEENAAKAEVDVIQNQWVKGGLKALKENKIETGDDN